MFNDQEEEFSPPDGWLNMFMIIAFVAFGIHHVLAFDTSSKDGHDGS